METFILKLILSFIVGGSWVTLSTIAAEKYGSKIGGIITGLPSTLLVSLFFIGWTQTTMAAIQATTLVPFVGGAVSLFLLAYLFLAPRINFWFSLIVSTLLWFVLALGIYFTSFRNFWYSLIIYILSIIISYFIIEKLFKIKSVQKKEVKYSFSILLFRGLFAGGIITLAVFLAKISGPALGGVFAMFPAAFIGTILVVYFQHSKEFSFPIMKVAVLSGISVVSFGLFVRYTYLPLGLWWGTLISLLIAWIIGYGVHLFVKKKVI
jgi:hypothetical protein